MLTKRIVPCLDVKNGRVVKGVNFKGLIDAGDPVEIARKYDQMGADELVFLDITATVEERTTICQVLERVASEVFIPLTVGGGISRIEDMKKNLRAGADKIAINSAAVRDPQLIRKGAKVFGSQCVVVAIDGKMRPDGTGWNVFTHGGRQDTGMDLIDWVTRVEELGAGEILLTSIDADGTKAGFDLPMVQAVASKVSIPVIASGGAGSLKDFAEVLTIGEADAALAASLFHFGEMSISELKEGLEAEGILVRHSITNGMLDDERFE